MAQKKSSGRELEIGLNEADKQALWRTVLVSGVVLGLVQTLLFIITGNLFPEDANWLNAVRTALSLLAFWVIITATVRTFDNIRKDVPSLWLVVIGISSAVVGIFLFLIALRLWNKLGDHNAQLPDYDVLAFFAAGGLIASLISLIHLRVQQKNTGNLLELLVIGLAAALFFWFAKG